MDITIGNSLAALQRANIKREPPEGHRLQSRILAVNYVSRRIQCQASGHANLRRVRVSDNINLGTAKNPKVYPGDIAKLEKNPRNGKWECVGIIHKVKCPPGTPVADAVEVDVAYEYSNSNITGGFGDTIVPELPFIPDVGALGQISLPSQLPQLDYLCGIPPCEDCSPDGYQDGMVPVLDASNMCWKWGFRSAPCGVYFKSQGAIYAAAPGASYNPAADVVVAVKDHYAYVAFRGAAIVPGTLSNSLLQTWDLSDPTAPVKVDEQALSSGGGTHFGSLSIAIWQNYLWVMGMELDYTSPTGSLAKKIKLYDITTRSAPSLTTSWDPGSLTETETLYVQVYFDGNTFSGNPHLIYGRGDPTDIFPLKQMIVADGLDGSILATVSEDFGTDSGYSPLWATVCDNTVIVQTFSGTTASLKAYDVSTPSAPSLLWTDNNMIMPMAHIGANRCYARKQVGTSLTNFTGGIVLYDQVNVSASRANVTFDTSDSYAWENMHYFLNTDCLYVVGQNPGSLVYNDTSWVWDISTPLSVVFEMSDVSPKAVAGEFTQAGADREGATIYMCIGGIYETSVNNWDYYLAVWTNRSA